MPDPGFISGFTSVGIDIAIKEILRHINIGVRCRRRLESLNKLLISLRDINSDIQKCRVAINSGQFKSLTFRPVSLNNWLKELDMLLQQANEMVQECTIPRYNLISRYRTAKKIARVITGIKEHRENAALIGITTQLLQILSHIQQSNKDITASASSSSGPLIERTKYIEEPIILGQDKVFTRLEELLQNTSRIGVVGMGGSGKTLLLKRIFNSQHVQNSFSNELLLWLTVSQAPSFGVLREELAKKIAFKLDERVDKLEGEDLKIWLNRKLSKNKFALFLDDVWEASSSCLLEELCVPPLCPPLHNYSHIIVLSSRDSRVPLQMGIPPPSTVYMQRLTEEDSWRLFVCHAFPYSNWNLPTDINEEIAKGVCKQCGGLPLAIKVIGRSMASITDSNEWEITLRKLQNAESIRYGDISDSLYNLRLSYDSLANVDGSLQLCFLYLAAHREDEVIRTLEVSLLWMGEGLLGGHNPLQTGQTFVNLLADRCLIEAIYRDIDGQVVCFRMHDVLYDLARQIAHTEEGCLFNTGRGFQHFPADDCERRIRISMASNSFTSIPGKFRGPHIRSWLMGGNSGLNVIPRTVIRSMASLRVLDLSNTSIQSLPKSIGCLKHLVCLRLKNVPIKRLPNSISALKKLQILDLGRSSIKELPSGINKLGSLKIMDIAFCKDLQSIPYKFSQLTSLELLVLVESPNARITNGRNKRNRVALSVNYLSTQKQLKKLYLTDTGETIHEGTLGSMVHMENLYLNLTVMERLPADMTAMSKLRKLWLTCPQLREMEHSFWGFQHLSFLRLTKCDTLKEVPADLHKLVRLKQLDIIYCRNIQRLPKEFRERGAFPMLEEFSLMRLDKLEELPAVNEAAMPSLKKFTVVLCEALKMLPENYWNLKSLEKIRVYGCPMVLQVIEGGNFIKTNAKLQVITMSSAETHSVVAKFRERCRGEEYWQYGEHWMNELLMFLANAYFFYVIM